MDLFVASDQWVNKPVPWLGQQNNDGLHYVFRCKHRNPPTNTFLRCWRVPCSQGACTTWATIVCAGHIVSQAGLPTLKVHFHLATERQHGRYSGESGVEMRAAKKFVYVHYKLCELQIPPCQVVYNCREICCKLSHTPLFRLESPTAKFFFPLHRALHHIDGHLYFYCLNFHCCCCHLPLSQLDTHLKRFITFFALGKMCNSAFTAVYLCLCWLIITTKGITADLHLIYMCVPHLKHTFEFMHLFWMQI